MDTFVPKRASLKKLRHLLAKCRKLRLAVAKCNSDRLAPPRKFGAFGVRRLARLRGRSGINLLANTRCITVRVNAPQWIVRAMLIQIPSANLPDGIAAEPPTRTGIVVAIAIVKESTYVIRVFGAKPQCILPRQGARGPSRLTKWAVLIPRSCRASAAVNQRRHISVAVIRYEMMRRPARIIGHLKEPAHPSGTL